MHGIHLKLQTFIQPKNLNQCWTDLLFCAKPNYASRRVAKMLT